MGDILSALGSIFTGNSDQNAANAASNASNQDTRLMNADNSQIQAILQQILGQYNANEAPLLSGEGNQYSGLLQASDAGGQAAQYQKFLDDPSGTLASQVGTSGVGTLLKDAGNNNALGQVTPQVIASIMQSLGSTTKSSTGGLNALTSADNGVAANDASGAGSDAVSFFLNQMQNGGISPALFSNATGQQQASNQANLNSLRNSLGGASNIGALMQNQQLSNSNATANLLANLTGQSAQLQQSAGANAASIQSGLNASKLAAAGQTQAANQSVNQQNYADTLSANQTKYSDTSATQQQQIQALLSAITTAGGVTSLDNSMLGGAASNALGNLGAVSGYTNAGTNQVAGQEGVLSGLSGQAQQLAGGSAQLANSDQQQANANNPFNALASIAGNYFTGGLLGGGFTSPAAASAPFGGTLSDGTPYTGAAW